MDKKQAKDIIKQRHAAIARAFGSPDGQTALEALRSTFLTSSLVGSDTHDTYLKIGRREVIEYIDAVIKQETT